MAIMRLVSNFHNIISEILTKIIKKPGRRTKLPPQIIALALMINNYNSGYEAESNKQKKQNSKVNTTAESGGGSAPH